VGPVNERAQVQPNPRYSYEPLIGDDHRRDVAQVEVGCMQVQVIESVSASDGILQSAFLLPGVDAFGWSLDAPCRSGVVSTP
jgi:hypothetical protein